MPNVFFNKNKQNSLKNALFLCFLLLFAVLIFSTCDGPMGMGDVVDLEPPTLVVTSIELPDGTVKEIIDENGKIFIGPGILFGKGAMLKGRATDNTSVAAIQVVESATNSVWTSTTVSRRNPNGWQDWSITLEGLQKGERNIEITALDSVSALAGSVRNIGPETVKQLTLLVDTEPPIVESIKIERQTGIFANLLPKIFFDEDIVTPDNFEHIDYFQNERFTIRASIVHEFNLSDVTLNFLDENGRAIFSSPRQRTGSTVYTPYWDITASDLISANPAYSTGRHILKVQINARAEAGHLGGNVITNQLFNLCWYPESDYPHVKIEDSENDVFDRVRSTKFPMSVFDDDNMKEVFYAIVHDDFWASYRPNETDEQKMAYIASNKNTFKDESNNSPLTASKYSNTATSNRIAVIPVEVGPYIGKYRLIVLATDKVTGTQGTSVMAAKIFTMNVTGEEIEYCDVVVITCENADGAYPLASELKFKMIFGGEVYTDGDVSITIQGGANGNQGGPITIPMSPLSIENRDFALTGSWTVPANIVFDPVVITEVNISGVRRYVSGPDPKIPSSVISAYNTSRTGLKVMSIKPFVTQINGQPVTNNETVLAPSGNKSQLTLTFSHAVYPENGTITIKPASGWLIPPVLTNDEFSKINSAVNSADQTALTNSNAASFYIKTTHGLTKNTSGQYTGTPDATTKYVLNFTSDLNNAVLRPILDRAKYNWQEVDVSTSQISGSGTRTITVSLDQLADGRLWKVEIVGPRAGIADGAFRDEAGNTFAGWDAASNNTFWSQKTAEPVIRVNRVSNNSATTNPTTNTVTGTMGTTSEVTSRVNVQFRIDCETPGATITYGTNTSKVATITTAMTDANVYKASSTDSGQNSNTANATVAELASTSFINPTTSYNASGARPTIGDTNLYTARKDYIAARATRSNLTQSNIGYEGAFKTLIVYRYRSDSDNQMSSGWLKFEATDTRNGAINTAGFPMNLNDRTGKGSKFAYRNATSNTAYTVDWIWITWEIVVDFWHVGMRLNSNTPNSAFTEDAWLPFGDEWYTHIFRKYGNWGLKVRN